MISEEQLKVLTEWIRDDCPCPVCTSLRDLVNGYREYRERAEKAEAELEVIKHRVENLILKWEERGKNEDNGVYPGEYYQPPSPSEVCANELKKILKLEANE